MAPSVQLTVVMPCLNEAETLAGCIEKDRDMVYSSMRPGGLFAFWENNPWNPGTRYVMRRIPFDRNAITLSPPAARGLLRKTRIPNIADRFPVLFLQAVELAALVRTWLGTSATWGPSIKSFARSLNDRASNDHEASFHSPLFGVPMRTCGGKWEIVQRLAINDFSRSKIDASVAELKEEKSLVSELL